MLKRKRAPSPAPAPGVDWSILENVRSEWPQSDFDADRDLAAWREGLALYSARDDYGSMIRAAGLMCRALRHHLYGPGLLAADDLPNTTHAVLFGSAFSPPDGQMFPTQVAAQLRLALTIVKKHAWQPVEHGGGGEMAEFLTASHGVLTLAVAPTEQRLWEGDLKRFFTTNPIDIPDVAASEPAPPQPTAPDATGSDSAIDSVYRSLQEAERGDPAADARLVGLAAAMAGDHAAALVAFERAANMGDVDSMYDAGSSARELGLTPQCIYWLEAAAAGGHSAAACNLGALAYNAGDVLAAQTWWKHAGDGGDANGYASLTQLADDMGDAEAELRWSRLGADGDHPFCQMRYGQLLMQAHPQDASALRAQVIPLLTKAAESGEHGALFLLGLAHGQLGDMSTARLWLKKSEASGDPDATRVLRQHGLT